MVLTTSELIASLQNEVRILQHLAGKVEASSVDYRPTPKQRSTIELLQYLTIMGPLLVKAGISGQFDAAAWTEEDKAARARSLEETVAAIAAQSGTYATLLAGVSDEAMREEVEMFGQRSSRGSYFVNLVLCAFAAYRTQLFCYLKSCGREELNTMNLWVGIDAPAG